VPVFQDLNIWPELDQILAGGGLRPPGGPRGAAIREALDRCRAEMHGLLRPAFAYESYPVTGSEPGALVIGDGHRLSSPVVAQLFAAAREVVLLAYTIGPLLEARVAGHRAQGDTLSSYVLDTLGSLAVTALGRLAHDHVKRLAAERGLRASIPLNPGTSHWPIEDHRLFLSLIPAAAIGLRLSDNYLLCPIKTNSLAIALGHDVLTDAEGSSCDYCARPELCRGARRRLFADPAHPLSSAVGEGAGGEVKPLPYRHARAASCSASPNTGCG